MTESPLQSLLNVFRGDKGKSNDDGELSEQLFLSVLARATSADTNIAPIEIKTVQQLYEEVFGEKLEASAVRTAAKSEIFEKTPLESYVKAAARKLSSTNKQVICRSLQRVLVADGRLGEWEIDFFNQMINALDMTPAQIAGLVQ